MNREERRKLQNNSKSVKIVEQDLDDTGNDFMSFAKENSVDLNVFFKMFSAWLSLSSAQKNAVIIDGIKEGLIVLEDKDEKHDSESK